MTDSTNPPCPECGEEMKIGAYQGTSPLYNCDNCGIDCWRPPKKAVKPSEPEIKPEPETKPEPEKLEEPEKKLEDYTAQDNKKEKKRKRKY